MGIPVLYAGSLHNESGVLVPIPGPAVPHFVSAEVGNVNATTIAVTFDRDVQASENDWLSDVHVEVNALPAGMTAGFRQANHAVVYYDLTAPVVFGDIVTWQYGGSGFIVSEADSTPLGIVVAQLVTNNTPDLIGDALRADMAAYWKMDETSGVRADATGHGANLQKEFANSDPDSLAGVVGRSVHFDNDDNPIPANAKFLGNGVGNPIGTIYPAGSNTPSIYLNLGDGKNFYIFGWIKQNPAFNPLSGYGIFFLRDVVFSGQTVYLTISPDGVGFSIGSWGTDPLAIDKNAWNFFEAYYLDANRSFYLAVNNGTFFEIIPDEGNTPENGIGPTFFGSGSDGQNPAGVSLDELGIIKRTVGIPLSQNERDYLYNSGAGRTLYP